MAVQSTDIVLRLSTQSGSAGGSTAGSNTSSTGKYCSTTAITDNTINNVFPDITGDQNAQTSPQNYTDYRCIFVHNTNSTSNTLIGPVLWIVSQVAGGATITIAVDPIAASSYTAAAAQANTWDGTQTNAPTGSMTFSSAATSKATGLALADLAPGQVRAIWLKRTITSANTAALNNDNVAIRIEGDTTA